MRTKVIVALIGAGATIIAAFIGLFAGKAYEQNSVQNQIKEVLGNNVNVTGDGNNVIIYDVSTLTQKHIEIQNQYSQLQSNYERLRSQNDYLLGENTKLSNRLDESNQKIEELERQLSEGETSNNNSGTNIGMNSRSAEELIEENFNLIQQLKAEYSDADIRTIENDYARFLIYEKAGYIYQNMYSTSDCIILHGINVFYTKVIIFDYYSDEMLYEFNPKESSNIYFSPGTQAKFYAVVFHDDYEIYVTPPIRVIGGESSLVGVEIHLERENSKYTPLFQCRLNIQDLITEEQNLVNSSDYRVRFNFKNVRFDMESYFYEKGKLDSDILSWGKYSYFSLNTNYIMDIYLSGKSDLAYKTVHQTIDGSIIDSNIINIKFKFNIEDDILE